MPFTQPLLASQFLYDFVSTGCVWSGDSYASTLNASMTAGTVWIGGIPVPVAAVTARAFTASKDTYIDIPTTGVPVYTEVTNNAASPALAANSVRIGIIITGAGSIAAATSVNQGQETMILPIASSIAYAVTDSLGNLICPRDPNRKLIGYKQILAGQSPITTVVDITGLAPAVIVPSGRKILITLEGFGGSTTTTDTLGTKIQEGATVLQLNQIAATVEAKMICTYVTTPTAGSHTYKGTALRVAGAGNMTFDAGATFPAFIKVELQ